MKKFGIILVSIFLLETYLFAAEHEATILGLGGNASFIYETSGLNGTKINASFNSFGFDVVFGVLQDNDWAVIDAISFDLPQKITVSTDDGTIEISRNGCKNLFLLNTIINFDYLFLNTERILLGVGPSINYAMLKASARYVSALLFEFGLGAQFIGMVKFTDIFGLHFGINALFDFYNISFITTAYNQKTNSGLISDFILFPFIGFSFVF